MATLRAWLEPPAAQTPSPNLEIPVPPELEAHEPPEARGLARDEVRLIISHREDDRIEHSRFRDIGRFIEAGDLQAGLFGQCPQGAIQGLSRDVELVGHRRVGGACGRTAQGQRACEDRSDARQSHSDPLIVL